LHLVKIIEREMDEFNSMGQLAAIVTWSTCRHSFHEIYDLYIG